MPVSDESASPINVSRSIGEEELQAAAHEFSRDCGLARIADTTSVIRPSHQAQVHKSFAASYVLENDPPGPAALGQPEP